MKNVMKLVEDLHGNINPRYDASIGDMRTIRENSDNVVTLFSNTFLFGYAQGMKAAKAEMKKAGAAQ